MKGAEVESWAAAERCRGIQLNKILMKGTAVIAESVGEVVSFAEVPQRSPVMVHTVWGDKTLGGPARAAQYLLRSGSALARKGSTCVGSCPRTGCVAIHGA